MWLKLPDNWGQMYVTSAREWVSSQKYKNNHHLASPPRQCAATKKNKKM